MRHLLPGMLFASLNPRVFRTRCLRAAKDKLLPRAVALRHLMLPEIARSMPGIDLSRAEKHYAGAAETVHRLLGDCPMTTPAARTALLARRARRDTQLGFNACAEEVRAWFAAEPTGAGAELRALLQKFARLGVEAHTLAGATLGGYAAPAFRRDERPLDEVARAVCSRFPGCAFEPEETTGGPPLFPPLPRALSRRVVSELVRNAVQNNSRPHHPVRVRCFLPPRHAAPGAAVLQVCNLGARPFRQSDACFARADPTRPGSLGMGLPQSRAICEMTGGSLKVLSSPAPGGQSLYQTVATARFYC